MMERKTAIVTINGQDYTIKELTVSQVEQMVAAIECGDYQGHIFDSLINKPLPANAFFMAIGVEQKEFNHDLAPSEVNHLYEKVIEVNPFCADLMERMYEEGVRRQRLEKPRASS